MFFDSSKYALKEELDEVKQKIDEIQVGQTEIKTGINLAKWILTISIAVIPLFTSVFEEIKDVFLHNPNQADQKVNEIQYLQLQKELLELKERVK